MTIEEFAKQHRLKIRRVKGDGSDSGDPRISGAVRARDGAGCDRQLYFNDGALCLMIIDGAPIAQRSWAALGGKLWLGDISRDSSGRKVQDVRVANIPLANAELAIRLVRAKRKRIFSEADLEARRLRGVQLAARKPI